MYDGMSFLRPVSGTPVATNMAIGRYPGPVWTLLLWTTLSAANLFFALVFESNNKSNSLATGSTLAFSVLASLGLIIMGGRTPTWFLWGIVVLGIASSTWLVYDALTPLGSALFALPYVIYSAYSALWGSRRLALSLLLVMAVAYLAVLKLKDQLPLLLVGWLLLVTICAGLILLLSYLVQNLRALAVLDPLTGLLNRTGLELLLSSNSGPISRSSQRLVVILDLDRFKTINDAQGHAAGDEALRAFGVAFRQAMRRDDVAIRTGGDEFMVILPETTEDAAADVIARLRSVTTLPWSFGVAPWPQGTHLDTAVQLADRRMYQSKAQHSGPDTATPS
jgi:diguanylate cyclase (GGDEF)-like protein